jgi:plastocyanin
MLRISLFILLVLGLSTALATGAFAHTSKTPTLVGTDGPGFTINLKKTGTAVKKLTAGKYTFVIHDRSAEHGWSLDGPHGFAKDISSVPGTGNKTVTLKLKAGKYKFYCPAHESTMFGNFTVK